jgi:hemerythrin
MLVPLYEWSDDICVGIPVIDVQHKNLVEILNRLHESIASGLAEHQIHEILQELVRYASEHFEQEESYLRLVHASSVESHIDMHNEFANYVMETEKALLGAGRAEAQELFYFLGSWLMHHIKQEDKVLSRFSHFFRS